MALSVRWGATFLKDRTVRPSLTPFKQMPRSIPATAVEHLSTCRATSLVFPHSRQLTPSFALRPTVLDLPFHPTACSSLRHKSSRRGGLHIPVEPHWEGR